MSSVLVEKRMQKRVLRSRTDVLRNNSQVFGVKAKLLSTLWAIATVALYDFARRLELKPCIEEFAALGTQDSLWTQTKAKAPLCSLGKTAIKTVPAY